MPEASNEEMKAREYEEGRASTEMNPEELAEMKRKQDEAMAARKFKPSWDK